MCVTITYILAIRVTTQAISVSSAYTSAALDKPIGAEDAGLSTSLLSETQ